MSGECTKRATKNGSKGLKTDANEEAIICIIYIGLQRWKQKKESSKLKM